MAKISAQMVKELRERTGAGMLDCKAALEENDGNVESAVDSLRKKGLAKAAKKAGREATEGARFKAEWFKYYHLEEHHYLVLGKHRGAKSYHLETLTDRFLARTTEPGLRPPGSRPVTFLHMAFPLMSIAGWPVPPGLAEAQDDSPESP